MASRRGRAFDLYCRRVDAAVASCSTRRQTAEMAAMLRMILEGETPEKRSSAREMLVRRVQALYARSANAQAAAADEFCRQAGIEPRPKEYAMPEEQAREIVGYFVGRLVDE